MRYLQVNWHHDSPDDPVVLYAEIDDHGWEQRKVDEYADGSVLFADAHRFSDDVSLADKPYPPIEQIALDDQFTVEERDAPAFEAIWERAQRSGAFVRLPDARSLTVFDMVPVESERGVDLSCLDSIKHLLYEFQPAARVEVLPPPPLGLRVWTRGEPEVAPAILERVEHLAGTRLRLRLLPG
jgi:hypothetical protein